MKFCTSHWSALREMVVEKGMGDLIQMTEAEASEELPPPHVLLGELPDMDYDPLFVAYWGLMATALNQGGTYLLHPRFGDGVAGGYCPMCEVDACLLERDNQIDGSRHWMDYATGQVLSYCRENNLLQRPQ